MGPRNFLNGKKYPIEKSPRTQAQAKETEENFSRARILNVGSKCLKETGAQGMWVRCISFSWEGL